MTQYIVFRHQDEVSPLTNSLRAYYEASIVGYYIGERGKKKQSIKAVADLLAVSLAHINLVPMIQNSGDIRSSIALVRGDITACGGSNNSEVKGENDRTGEL